ncbi:MAG: CDP-alcohol phosphatidyltransferase family protein [Chitinispirillaceae bacterium]|nr:CDP-alcohol phosphatidyltransferase family protein [Chitinispirillaceae bacterium]
MNIAVMFTLSRVAVAPFFALFFILGYRSGSPLLIFGAVICAILIELSDMFDGMIARARKEVTDFGKVFDPVADSVSRQTVFIAFMVSGIIPLWMYLIFFYRDAFMQLMRIVCASGGLVLAARMSGKVKAVLQAIATFVVLALVLADLYHLSWVPVQTAGKHTGFWVVGAVAVFTVLSVIDYIIPNRAILKKVLTPK